MEYPTGGYSEFEYEAHAYSKRLETRSQDGFIPQLYDVTGQCGGVRIKKIVDFEDNSSTQPINVKAYKYVNNYNVIGGGSSSGILLKWPRYVLGYQNFSSGGFGTEYGYIRSNPIGKNLMENLHIAYSEVAEVTNGNGYIVTKYRDFITNGDKGTSSDVAGDTGNVNNNSFYRWKPFELHYVDAQPAGLAKNYVGYYLNDTSIERGKPWCVKVHDVEGALQKETLYEYNEDPNRFDLFTTKLHLTGLYVQANKLYHYSDFLTKTIEKNYLDNGMVTTVESREYDQDIKKMIGNTVVTTDNNVLHNDYDYLFLPNQHLSLLDGTASFRNNLLTSKSEYQYGDEDDVATANKYYVKEIKSSKFSPILDGEGTKVTVHRYDAKGNPLEVSKENDVHTCYVWGYQEFLPIAKIENATYSEIEGFVDNLHALSNADSNRTIGYGTAGEGALRQALDNLRNEPTLSNALITTYTHDPLIGVTSVTNPQGNVVYYDYDGLERLISVKDKNGKKLTKNEYNHKPQN